MNGVDRHALEPLMQCNSAQIFPRLRRLEAYGHEERTTPCLDLKRLLQWYKVQIFFYYSPVLLQNLLSRLHISCPNLMSLQSWFGGTFWFDAAFRDPAIVTLEQLGDKYTPWACDFFPEISGLTGRMVGHLVNRSFLKILQKTFKPSMIGPENDLYNNAGPTKIDKQALLATETSVQHLALGNLHSTSVRCLEVS